MALGLAEYYMVTRDYDGLDALVAFADQTTHYSMVKDKSGSPLGWTYTFGDYWGPYTQDDLNQCADKSYSVSFDNYRIAIPLGFAYQFTGRDDYKSIMQLISDSSTNNERFLISEMGVIHPKSDIIPPSAITDLSAKVTANGGVIFTFSASGDDAMSGAASSYQLKASTSPIVEQIQGWPDLNRPLPQNKEQWEQRSEEFSATQRTFWSAKNVDKISNKMPAGQQVQYTVYGLSKDTYYFAIKAYDENDNVSELSNVIRVVIK